MASVTLCTCIFLNMFFRCVSIVLCVRQVKVEISLIVFSCADSLRMALSKSVRYTFMVFTHWFNVKSNSITFPVVIW